MKPVVIIAISVGCSVAAVLGVLVALEMYAVNEAQKAYAIELERQAVCERLYDGYAQSLRDTELWGICINYGISEAVNEEISDCGRGTHHTTELCRLDTKILAMKVVNEELTLDTKFRDSFTKDSDTLQVTRQKLVSDRQIEEQQNKIKFEEMAFIEQDWIKKYDKLRYTDWYIVYQECMKSEIEHYDTDFLHKKLCDDSLKSAISNVCTQGCNLTYQNIVSNTVDPDGLYFNTEQARYEQKVSYCASMGGGYYAPLEEVKGCMCGHEIDYSGWYDLCRSGEIIPQVTQSETISEDAQLLSEIENEYLECKMNEKYGTKCKDQLKERMDLYCMITTDSHTEYDECFGQITEIQ